MIENAIKTPEAQQKTPTGANAARRSERTNGFRAAMEFARVTRMSQAQDAHTDRGGVPENG